MVIPLSSLDWLAKNHQFALLIPRLQREVIQSIQTAYSAQHLFNRISEKWEQRKSRFPQIRIPNRERTYERIYRAKNQSFESADLMYEYLDREIDSTLTQIQHSGPSPFSNDYLERCVFSLHRFHKKMREMFDAELGNLDKFYNSKTNSAYFSLQEEIDGELLLYEDVHQVITDQYTRRFDHIFQQKNYCCSIT